ncbi:MAG: taurine ABC transporter substrate-binding protein [Burkholderiales bacterium]|nr:taurine ABC transporter substrate-binding protein [Burkholderiales bacterium]
MMSYRPLPRWMAACALAVSGFAQAQTKEVTFAHQDMVFPYRTVMESGELEKATGYKINWRMFGGGGDVIKAMASGDVQIGEVGSSPLAAATSQGQDIKLVWILDDIASSDVLVARNGAGISSWKDLKGKKVAVPFVSTAHYSLMVGMKLAGVDAKSVSVMNMRPPEIAAAWERGDIDASFIWDPVLSKIRRSGTTIATSGDVGKQGFPTFDGLVVNAKWAAENKGFVVALVKAISRADAEYRANAAKWTATSPQVKAIAKWTKADEKDVPDAMAAFVYPDTTAQLSSTWLGGGAAKTLANTSMFLKEQGRLQEVKPDYNAFVDTSYLVEALKK